MAEKILQDPDTIIRILQEIKNEREKRIAAEEKNRADAPKVLFADSVAQAESDILIGELAKLLKQNGVETGQNRLYDRLRKDGYIMKNSTIPTQKAMEAGLFRVIERTIAQPNGTTRITATTKVTGKGQIYFVNKYAKKMEQ
jgi:anti-repressor protein